ncbi:peptidase M20 [Actibacterium atlanticum]|uniref:Peptidase M20 n=1 Tax=Actibacterium atlanticum TaxID=1461693 RepID=A0A058ZNC4_9RHOB|nr:M20 family metallopeptidase [Actibacterium atlanticum]KCV82296.1 peptidase M20 [Actibacterium atlanticum]
MAAQELTPFEQSVVNSITEEAWLDLASALIRCGQPDSGNALDPDQPPAKEEAIAYMVAGELKGMGFTVEMPTKRRGRPNVLGRIKGGEGPSLMINDHLDTYPVVEPEKWDKTDFDPYKATRHGDLLYARGTSDTRGNMASALIALQAVTDAKPELAGELIACFTVDEERDGTDGSIFVTQELGLKPDYSITAEPTAWGGPEGPWGLSVSTANSGHCLVEIELTGTKGHIWRPDIVANPILEAGRLLSDLETMAFTHVPHKFMGHTPPMCSVVRIRGGLTGEIQFSPDTCTITLSVVGIVPGMTMESVLQDIQNVTSGMLGGRNDIAAAVRQVPGSLFVAGTPNVEEHEEPVATLSDVYETMRGERPRLNRKNAFNDTIRFREAGVNAVTFGPGEDGWAADNEWISIPKSVEAAKIYAVTIMRLLGAKQ